jgi:hypothetical protein
LETANDGNGRQQERRCQPEHRIAALTTHHHDDLGTGSDATERSFVDDFALLTAKTDFNLRMIGCGFKTNEAYIEEKGSLG